MSAILKQHLEIIPEEVLEHIKSIRNALQQSPNDKEREWANGLDFVFGEDTLSNSYKSAVKTWSDIESIFQKEYSYLDNAVKNLFKDEKDLPIAKKIKATYKLTRLLESGYAGVITDKEYNQRYDNGGCFFAIWPGIDGSLEYHEVYGYRNFLIFRTEELVKKFLSCAENRVLALEYYMLKH